MSNKLIMALLVLTTCFRGYAAEEKINLQSGDGKVANGPIFKVSKELFSEYSKTLRDMFEEIQKPEGKAGEDQKAEDDNTPIPLPNINEDTLKIIINCIQQPDDAERILLSLKEYQLRNVTTAIMFLDMPKLYAQLPQVKWIKSIADKPIMLKVRHSGTAVAISPDGRYIATKARDKTATIWDAKTGKQIQTLKGHTGYIRSIAFSPDNTYIVTGAADKTAIIWNAKTGEQIHTLKGHLNIVTSVAFSPDGRSIITGSWDNTAIIWDAKTGKQIRTLECKPSVDSVAFSPDNTSIVTGSLEHTVIIWNAKTGEQIRTLHTEHYISSVAFSPDNTSIVIGLLDGTAIILDAKTGKEKLTLKGHVNGVESVAFSPDNTSIITGSEDGTAIIWDAKTGKQIRTLECKASVDSVAFSPNNTYIVTGTDNTVNIWPLYNPEQLDTLPIEQQNLIIMIYEAKEDIKKHAARLYLNRENADLYRQLPEGLQLILSRYVLIPEVPKS